MVNLDVSPCLYSVR